MDGSPCDRVTGSLAVAEALSGQPYPAVLIAGVLGMALQSQKRTE